MTKKTIESRVADTVLQRPASISIGDKTYNVPAPTLATLIEISERISMLPDGLGGDNAIGASFKDLLCGEQIAEICAIYILGSAKPMVFTLSSIKHLIGRRKSVKRLTNDILQSCTPKDIFNIFQQFTERAQISDFFAVTTFLGGLNLTKPTKVVKETTVSGR